MSIVKAENLVFEYIKRDEDGNVDGINRAVDNLNIEVEAGQFIAIVGHNGSGKSTFARHINALLLPTEGTVYVADKDTSDGEKLWDIRQTAGMVFQNPDNQIVGTIVEEDVGFGPENLGVPTDEIWERVDNALDMVGMSAYREYSPGKLSGGQKQRVAIAGVMAMRPKCIIMDEPTAMLDPVGRREVLDAVLELNRRERVTVILITHYMNEIVNADRVFVMDKGRLVMEGTPREIFAQADKLEQIRLEVPQAAELAHRLAKAGIPVDAGVLTAEELVEEICRLY
ncbi:MAG: energy-coupling factor transporter ATPase [Butyrivibrio sp.]|nr:energy-coupling factor transporter ATPase [Butyrivibrio sp.]